MNSLFHGLLASRPVLTLTSSFSTTSTPLLYQNANSLFYEQNDSRTTPFPFVRTHMPTSDVTLRKSCRAAVPTLDENGKKVDGSTGPMCRQGCACCR